MFGSTVLEVAVGLIFIYLVLSLVCTSVNEYIAQLLNLRAENLYHAIHGLFDGPDAARIVEEIYQHPMVLRLGRKKLSVLNTAKGPIIERKKPSYIPAATFSAAVTELLGLHEPPGARTSLTEKEFADALNAATAKYDDQIIRSLRPLINAANGSLDRARLNIEKWYDEAMERAIGWYKRKLQTMTFCVALCVVLITNADTLMILNRLWSDPTQRAAITAQASRLNTEPQPQNARQLDKATQDVAAGLLGWAPPRANDPRSLPSNEWGWLMKSIGLIISAFAVSLGAPFWFDMLNKIMNIRSAGASPNERPKNDGKVPPAEKDRIASSDALSVADTGQAASKTGADSLSSQTAAVNKEQAQPDPQIAPAGAGDKGAAQSVGGGN